LPLPTTTLVHVGQSCTDSRNRSNEAVDEDDRAARLGSVTSEATLRTGDPVLIRPIRPSDKSLLIDGLQRLSPESRYRRFFSPVPKLGASQLRYLTEVDHHAHEALVALDPRTGAGVGVAGFIRSSADPAVAEIAIAVVDDWQGRGLGTELLHELAARAREEGVRRVSAFVLERNPPMLRSSASRRIPIAASAEASSCARSGHLSC
jgi:RimJ/RimL family protein N-acetyltransferase